MTIDSKKSSAATDTRVIAEAGAPKPAGGANTDDVETFVVATSANRPVAQLLVTAGPGAGQRKAVHTGTSPIGRDPQSNRIALDAGDTFISRTGHAVLVHDPRGGLRILDGGKANGVKVNGRRVERESLVKFGDTIEIGQTALRLDPP